MTSAACGSLIAPSFTSLFMVQVRVRLGFPFKVQVGVLVRVRVRVRHEVLDETDSLLLERAHIYKRTHATGHNGQQSVQGLGQGLG